MATRQWRQLPQPCPLPLRCQHAACWPRHCRAAGKMPLPLPLLAAPAATALPLRFPPWCCRCASRCGAATALPAAVLPLMMPHCHQAAKQAAAEVLALPRYRRRPAAALPAAAALLLCCRRHRHAATAVAALLPPLLCYCCHCCATAASATMLTPLSSCCHHHCHQAATATTAAKLLPLPLPPR